MTVSDLTPRGQKVPVFQDLSQTTLRKKEGSEQNYSLPDKAHVKYRRSFLCKCILTHQEQQYIIKGKRRQLKALRSWNAWRNGWSTVYFSKKLCRARGRTAAKPKRQSQQKAKKNSCSPRVQGAGWGRAGTGENGNLVGQKKVQVGLRKPEGLKTWEQQGECEPKSKQGGARAMESQESLGSLLGWGGRC